MPFNTKLVVPIALGLSLVTVSAFVVYYLFKKEDDETKKCIKTSRMNTIEIMVSKSIVPALIGRSGSNIKGIEAQAGCRIHFKKFSDKDYDVCIIQGRSQATQIAETMVHEFIKNQPLIEEQAMLVPGWSCGRIIGTGGENINDISHRSGARVKIESSSGMGETGNTRQVTFRGTKEQIEVARVLIEKIISVEKCRREIEQSKRVPRHVPSPLTSPAHTLQNCREPNTNSQEPISNSQEPNTNLQGPNANLQEPITNLQEPNGNYTEPAIIIQDSSSSMNNNTIKSTSDLSELPGDTPKAKHASLKKSEISGGAIEVYVSAVSSPSRFWVQFVGAQVSQLDELVQQMTDYYSNRDNREMHALRSVTIGQVVAGVFRHDGKWYRARVVDIKPNEFDPTQEVADVFYVDYGDSEYVAVHELCELRADLLRLRFQAMECFLAGVKPAGSDEDVVAVTSSGERWHRWHPQAIERFEELTQVARWKTLVSKTCSYKNTSTAEGEKEREIPGIKLYDITEEGEVDIGGVLTAEGWAVTAASTPSPRASPARPTPFGDLGSSMVLGMVGQTSDRSGRGASLPHDHARTDHSPPPDDQHRDGPRMSTSMSLGSGLEAAKSIAPKTISTQPQTTDHKSQTSDHKPQTSDHKPQTSDHKPEMSDHKPHTNGSDNFLNSERLHLDKESELDNHRATGKSVLNEFKANMNRIDSHHDSLESMGKHADFK